MESNFCLICRSAINSSNQIDMQFTTTKLGQINVLEFLKEMILEVDAQTDLPSDFLCVECFAAINTLEDHFIMYKTIQKSLTEKYIRNYNVIKSEESEEINESKEGFAKSIIPEESLNKCNNDSGGDKFTESKSNVNPEIEIKNERKSPRKSRKILNYSEQDEEITQKKSKGNIKKLVQNVSTKNNSGDITEDELLKLPPQINYCCEICGKQYLNYNGFNIHRRKHRNENLIRCEYCNKTFAQKGGLVRHLHQHTGTFPYQCDICDKKFTHQSSLKIHKDIHDGRRDYICDTCGMAFYSRAHLRSHINRHTKEVLHGCAECGATFTEKYNMRVHRLKVHGVKD